MNQSEKLPIINCHTHIFTGDHVPPYLGKSILKWPIYKLLNFQWIFRICIWWYSKGPYKRKFGGRQNDKLVKQYQQKMFIQRTRILYYGLSIIGWYFTIQVIYYFFYWNYKGAFDETKWLHKLHFYLHQGWVLFEPAQLWIKLLILLGVLLFFKSGRNLLLFIAKNTYSVLNKIPGKQTRDMLSRYMTIGRFSFHRNQATTLAQLRALYPKGTGFVVLPMDLEYMDAGLPKESYADQMSKLARIKSGKSIPIYPFVFVDPRRIAADPNFFNYKVINKKVVLEDCFIKEYIEKKKFSGFKIYPALGYYPFDPLLLPLWKYAQQQNLPIMTHCVRGPMYYRGTKKKEWDEHPIFEQSTSQSGVYRKLLLNQVENDAFSTNFTHPLNYLCLLKRKLLTQAVVLAYKETGKDARIKDLFGLETNVDKEGNTTATIKTGLEDLKICLGHYGGDDEWLRYYELDRYTYSTELSQNPHSGIDFLHKKGTSISAPGKIEQLWKHCDWYSIITSIMLQHKNIYADISFILHSDSLILPLLKQTMRNKHLRSRVLFGTDFYVVRNHKSEKQMLAEMMGGLEEEEFNQIARRNPKWFV